MMVDLVPLGDRAWMARFASEGDARRWSLMARSAELPGVVDIVLAYAMVSIHLHTDAEVEESLATRLHALASFFPTLPHKGRGILEEEKSHPLLEPRLATTTFGRLVTLPVLYDGDDLPEVATTVGISVEEVIQLHSGTIYDVFAIGFQPGFPYAGPLPPPLDRLPRRPDPRVRVPIGSVAIAAGQTGVYPAELPGGWNLLGRTPLSIVDIAAGRFPIRAGDRLQFEPIDRDEFHSRSGELLH
jgi:KipI family sensor histidine kinase inhibitor